MDRALSIDTLTAALGQHPRLPSPAQLQQLLANTEISLFTGQAVVEEGLVDTAWYLQAVATARDDLQLYPIERRRLAHQVSAHIFDLTLQSAELDFEERLRYTFAAQIGYLGGDLTPNAAALARRVPLPAPPFDWPGPGVASMEAGVLLLALSRRDLYPLLRARRQQLDSFADQFGNLAETPFASSNDVLRAAWDLTNFLTYGRPEARESAVVRLRAAMESKASEEDVDSRWVAAHLLNMSEALGASSVWSVLPPDIPGASRAMTLGEPPVLLLWPPQLSFLGEQTDEGMTALSPEVKRLVLSFPTSAGKSLLAQLLVITQLLRDERDVCVVAPTHSLCRELASALERRLRTLGYELYEDAPLGLWGLKPPGARVVVMTPEKLAARLRNSPSALLEEFGMFVVDEAHLVADGDRGWRLEETVSLLHHLTRNTEHRLLVLSAALGNQAHIIGWLGTGESVISKHENWRGPRRLNVVYTRRADWDRSVDEPAVGNRQARQRVPLLGILHLKTPSADPGGVGRQFSEPVGELVLRWRNGRRVRDDATTRERTQLVPLIAHVAESGPVLIVEATRTEVHRLAAEVMDGIGEGVPSSFALIDTIRSRLGDDHLLTRTLTKGVAFHHSALPVDIQAEIEEAVRSGDIRCLVATTTLVEGVNLPFKTVIVAHRGYYSSDGYVELLDAPRLLNAIGRAGRAGRETEGWLILSERMDFAPSMFNELERTGAELEVRSTITSDIVLAALARIEAEAATGQDALLVTEDTIAAGFVSYVWFLADALEEVNGEAAQLDGVNAAIRETLAWHQLDPDSQGQLLSVAELAYESYSKEEPGRRRRWSRSGLTLPSAQALENIAAEIFSELANQEIPATLSSALALIIGGGRLTTLLSLPENLKRGFKVRRNAPADQYITVDLEGLLMAWLGGVELQPLADQYLSVVMDSDYRYEQLSEFIASVFEHYIPWSVGILVGWLNARFEELNQESRFPEALPGAIHFGVGSTDALALMLNNIRSRRLANRVANIRREEQGEAPEEPLRDWLINQDIAAWRERFEASPTELLDLLVFARSPEARMVNEILSGGTYLIPFVALAPLQDGQDVAIEPEASQPFPPPLVIVSDGSVLGRISPGFHDDMVLLREIGIPMSAKVVMTPGPSLELRAVEEA